MDCVFEVCAVTACGAGDYSELGRSLERSTIPSGIEGCRAGDSVLGRLVGLDVSRIVASPS